MYSPDKICLKEFNKIVSKDLPDLRRYPSNYFDFIIDVGANIGIYTIYSKILFPNSKIISIEPDREKRVQSSLWSDVLLLYSRSRVC